MLNLKAITIIESPAQIITAGMILLFVISETKPETPPVSGTSGTGILTEKLIEYNPLNLSDEEKRIFYKNNISKFIETVTFGMTPKIKWDGNYVVSGGLLTVKKDGEILCHHLFYDNISLKNYLFKNTKLEGGSTSRHEYAQLYKQNDDIFFKLNLQLRFK